MKIKKEFEQTLENMYSVALLLWTAQIIGGNRAQSRTWKMITQDE